MSHVCNAIAGIAIQDFCSAQKWTDVAVNPLLWSGADVENVQPGLALQENVMAMCKTKACQSGQRAQSPPPPPPRPDPQRLGSRVCRI